MHGMIILYTQRRTQKHVRLDGETNAFLKCNTYLLLFNGFIDWDKDFIFNKNRGNLGKALANF